MLKKYTDRCQPSWVPVLCKGGNNTTFYPVLRRISILEIGLCLSRTLYVVLIDVVVWPSDLTHCPFQYSLEGIEWLFYAVYYIRYISQLYFNPLFLITFSLGSLNLGVIFFTPVYCSVNCSLQSIPFQFRISVMVVTSLLEDLASALCDSDVIHVACSVLLGWGAGNTPSCITHLLVFSLLMCVSKCLHFFRISGMFWG